MDNRVQRAITQNWVKFTAHKILNTEVVWLDQTDNLLNCNTSKTDIYKNICRDNAYAIKDTPCFSELEFDENDSKVLIAERYGGTGIGVNGGGGRCGNTEQYQLKGIGANCMVGEHDDVIHKYGGLDAPLAIIETIYTNLLCVLLPLGAVRIRGIIYIGKKTAIYHHPANKCWGVIMLRDHCIRPAHLMRAPSFKPQSTYQPVLIKDKHRVKNINKELFKHFKDNNQFILFLGKYLQNCANQFGFARAVRLMHGTLSPSNISMDGQWLDLPIASMLNGGINHSLSSHFYNEHQTPLEYALELLHGYSKYNNALLNAAPLINYYHEQFDAYLNHYIGYILGLDLDLLKNIKNDHWKSVSTQFIAVIHAGKHLDDRQIAATVDDPVHALIAGTFISIINLSKAEPCFALAKIPLETSIKLARSFAYTIDEIWEKQNANSSQILRKDYFTVGSALIALKRAYLAEVFFAPLIAKNTWDLCQEKTTDDIASFIDSYSSLAQWIFKENDLNVYLFKAENIEIFYSMDGGTYSVKRGENISQFQSYIALFSALQDCDPKNFVINHFNFINYFERLYQVIPSMEDYNN